MEDKEIIVPYITTRECTTDILMEPLGLDKLVQFRYNLGVISSVTITKMWLSSTPLMLNAMPQLITFLNVS